MADPTRFERVTFAFGGQLSIQLSYGSVWRSFYLKTPHPATVMAGVGLCCFAAPGRAAGRRSSH